MAEYPDRFTKPSKTGRDIDLMFGVIHDDIALGTSITSQTTVTFNPATYGPFYPYKSYPNDFEATKGDIIVYDDGVPVTVSQFNPETGVATITTPTVGSIMTGKCVEQRGLYILQKATLTPKQEDEKLDQLRNPTQRKTYGTIEFTLKGDLKIADIEPLKLIFQQTETTGLYEFPDEPPEIFAALILYDANDDIEAIIYCDYARAAFQDILTATAGKKAIESGFELTIGLPPHMLDVAESLAP